MTKEDKDLVLHDLCERLPYEPIVYWKNCNYGDKNKNVVSIDIFGMVNDEFSIEECKPYLRPMFSMTEEEKNELKEYLDAEEIDCNGFGYSEGGTLEDYISSIPYSICVDVVNWLNKNMFDFRGLIPRGCAISTEEFNPYEN